MSNGIENYHVLYSQASVHFGGGVKTKERLAVTGCDMVLWLILQHIVICAL